MGYEKVGMPTEVYHLTKKKNLDNILEDQTIRRFGDTECWFCRSIPDMNRYMEMTVLCEGKPYVDVDGHIKRYPKFEPDDYVVLRLTPKHEINKWYQWNQVVSPYASPEVKQQAMEFSKLKVGFRGNLEFKDCQVLEMAEVMNTTEDQNQGEDADPMLSM